MVASGPWPGMIFVFVACELESAIGAGNRAVERSARRRVDERIHLVEEDIAHVHDVGVPEVHDRVAVGVGARDVADDDLLAVQMELTSLAKVTTGSAMRGSGLTFMFMKAMNCSLDIRLRTLSCATITTPALPRFSLPPV